MLFCPPIEGILAPLPCGHSPERFNQASGKPTAVRVTVIRKSSIRRLRLINGTLVNRIDLLWERNFAIPIISCDGFIYKTNMVFGL